MRNHQGRSEPTAQQSARISRTTPSGCADAPPHEKKVKSRTSAFSEIGGLLRQLLSLGVEGGRSEVVVVLQDGQKTDVRTKAAKTKFSKKFQAACSAADSELGDYTQWVR